jgi:two-component system OmpR family sensor kinase
VDDEAIRRSEARFRALFQALDLPITLNELVRDADGTPRDIRQLAANRAHDRMMGHGIGSEVGLTASEVRGGPSPELVAAAARVMETGEPAKIVTEFRDARTFDIKMVRVDGQTLAIAGTEVTELRSALADRERLLAEREELVRTISHDLRAPLTSISSQAQLLFRAPESERVERKARAIAANAARMGEMIRDLVDIARVDAGLALAPAPVPLAPFLAELVERLDGGLESARISVSVSDGLAPVRADPAKLERVVVNLLANALRHGPPGTPVELTARAGDGVAILEVADRGPGIDPEDLPRIFDRFYRSPKAGGEGLGLGLHIARRFVEAHGGTIAASSDNRGATFRVDWPLAR